MSSPDQKSPGFTVTDRRASAHAQEPAAPAVPPAASADQPVSSPSSSGAKLPPVDFVTFVMSIASAVVVDLGEADHPETGKAQKNLPMAKHTIDILSMLQDKTKSNLSTQEAGILETLLYDLRLSYVVATKA